MAREVSDVGLAEGRQQARHRFRIGRRSGPVTAAQHRATGPVRGERRLDGVRVVTGRDRGHLDRLVGAAFGAAGGLINHRLRTTVLRDVTRTAGDVLVYQRHHDEIHRSVRETIADVDPTLGSRGNPIDVVAHSLGGVIAVDMAVAERDPLHIRRRVTFGSQAPFFHVCDPRGGALADFDGTPVALPDSVGAWTNLWEPLDPLAFVADGVFTLHDGSRPQDLRLAHLASSGLWTHTVYWGLEQVAGAIATALR